MFQQVKSAIDERVSTTSSRRIFAFFISLLVLFAFTPGIIGAEETGKEEGWQFHVEPYMWAAGISVTTASGSDVEIEFDDILDNLDMTFMGVFGARKGKWSLLADLMYLNMSKDDISYNAIIPVGPLGSSSVFFGVDADVEMTSWILTPAAAYTIIQNETMSMDVVGGARYLYLKSDAKLDITAELDVELLRRSIVRTGVVNERIVESGHVWDGIIGARGQVSLSEKWYVPYYADIGTGETDLTWQTAAGVGYRFTKIDVIAGYRYLAWEFDDDSKFDDMDVSGPYVGFKFIF